MTTVGKTSVRGSGRRQGGTTISYSGFFSVGRDSFIKACDLGIKPATVFLVLARGSARDNVTTKWSAQAAADRAGMRWTSAKQAITQLLSAGIAKETKGGTRPEYELAHDGDDLWLPNVIVDGASVSEMTTPLSRIRQTHDPMLLRLFVELYGDQNLKENGGISAIWCCYEREQLGKFGQYVAWRFHGGQNWVNWEFTATKPHRRKPTAAEAKQGRNEGVDLFARFDILCSLRLVEFVPYLFDGPEGEPIHPLAWDSSIPLEEQLYTASQNAALRCLLPSQSRIHSENGGILAILPRHIDKVLLLGVYRLRYRPHTKLTGAWWVEHEERCRNYVTLYENINPSA